MVRIETPKTPTNQNEFKINFVALDQNNNVVTVRCYKQSPTDIGFVQFDADKVLKAGGNSGSCQVNNSIVNSNGSYKFKVIAVSDVTTESNVVTVDFNNSTPGTPNSYSKEKTATCQYTIRFRTDNDGGKTTKVVLYRSDNTSFTADPGSQVDSRSVGSNQAVEMVNSIPDCNKTYYYAVRAFDNSGNGSGIIGDENITVVNGTTTTTTSTTTPSQGQTTGTGALLADESSVTEPGQEEGTLTPEAINEENSSEVLGTQTKEPFWKSNNARVALIAAIIALAAYFWFKGKKK